MPLIFNLAYRLIQNGQRIVPAALYNTAAEMAPHLKQVGFDGVQLFPFTVSQSGTAANGDGYGKQFDYNLSPTRFGTIDELQRSIGVLNACGLDAGSDEVIHQYDGAQKDGSYPELGPDGKLSTSARFFKPSWCFVPTSPVDQVFDSEGNFGFGSMVSYVNSGHNNYMLNGTIAAMVQRAKRIGNKFYRLDDTKGESISVSAAMINALNAQGLYGYGECFSGSTQELETWDGDIKGRAGTLDFPLHWGLVNACNGYNANALRGAGLCLQNPGIAWKFRDNGDTDTSAGQAVIANGLMANHRILTAPGTNTLVYAKDYLPTSVGGYGLSAWMDTQFWIAKNLAFGDEVQRYENDNSVAVFERLGFPGLLTAFNFDTYNNRKVTVQTNFGPGVELWEYTGKHSAIWTDGSGRATFTIPCNAYSSGRGYLSFSRTGYTQGFTLQKRSTKQSFFGAHDLKEGPAVGGSTVTVGRIWCDAGAPIILYPGASAKGLVFGLLNTNGLPMKLSAGLKANAAVRGWYTVTVTAPATVETQDFEITLEYTGSQGLLASEV
jgi:alpha-amylase